MTEQTVASLSEICCHRGILGWQMEQYFASRFLLVDVVGHKPTVVAVKQSAVEKIRITMQHATGGKSGLTEIEAWGMASLPVTIAPPPAGNYAYNDGSASLPRATASHSDRFGGIPKVRSMERSSLRQPR